MVNATNQDLEESREARTSISSDLDIDCRVIIQSNFFTVQKNQEFQILFKFQTNLIVASRLRRWLRS